MQDNVAGFDAMRVALAPDSFKECLSAVEVAAAMAAGFRRALPDAELIQAPMADGGEGTVDAMVAATSGRRVELDVTGPQGGRVRAAYGLLDDGRTAVVEMAAASGLSLIPREQRDPRRATTYGTGELMRDALDRGVDRIIVGIGGSATNDAGAGVAQALGVRLQDAAGRALPFGGAALAQLARIDREQAHPRLESCEILAACDVDNPLCGPRGASHVYGPQKGASPEAVEELDAALRHFADVVKQQIGVDVLEMPGAGAAGGLGAGLVAFAGGLLRPGFGVVAEACHLSELMEGAALVVTGEGKLDGQSGFGKTPIGVARLAQKKGIPVVVIAGTLGADYRSLYELGIDAAFSICDGPMGLEAAMADAKRLLADRAEAIGRMAGRMHAGASWQKTA